MFYEQNYLQHHGIKGQQWGVRRFQNEDGTLTEEGRRRYLANFEKKEKQADKDIEQARRQLADIEKNGWNARSAFDKGFVKQLKDEGMLNDDNLNFFKKTFEDDLSTALSNKKAAQAGRDFINQNKNVTYDDILKTTDKVDKSNREGYKRELESLGKDMDLKTKKEINEASKNKGKIKVNVDDKFVDHIKKNYSKQEMQAVVDNALDMMPTKQGREQLYNQVKAYPLETQAAILFTLMYGEAK